MYIIRETKAMGRGLYANTVIVEGEIVASCEVLLLSEQDTRRVNRTSLKHYVFRFDDTRDCLVLGDGEIFNHADTPNVSYSLQQVDGRIKMIFVAIATIRSGQQLFIDYNKDMQVNVQDYIRAASLVS